jgi:hypothetical protein
MNPEIIPEQGESARKALRMGQRKRNKGPLDGKRVDGESGRRRRRYGDIEVCAPADAFGIDPRVFVFWVMRVR